jgi:hypothetical protein
MIGTQVLLEESDSGDEDADTAVIIRKRPTVVESLSDDEADDQICETLPFRHAQAIGKSAVIPEAIDENSLEHDFDEPIGKVAPLCHESPPKTPAAQSTSFTASDLLNCIQSKPGLSEAERLQPKTEWIHDSGGKRRRLVRYCLSEFACAFLVCCICLGNLK